MADDAGLNSPPTVMMTVAELAERDRVSRPAISQKVKRLVEQHGLEVSRDDRGRVARINVAQYDMLRERVGDPSKDQRKPREAEGPPTETRNDSYDEALRLKTWYEAERKRLELDEQIGKLVRVDDVMQAVDTCSAAIAAAVRKLQNETDALATVVARDGVHGLRVALKALETKMLSEISTALDAVKGERANAD
ncbi:MAG TPA: ArsR family transcriptional regulator [Xanthobacteraceae bacterium]|nr:ArsR family transcriptional regulator [Xanthobacteraceae bacterium]